MPIPEKRKAEAAAKAQPLRDYFVSRRIAKPNKQAAVELAVNDWQALELFMMENPTMEYNPGGSDIEHIIIAAQAAIEDEDAVALRDCLLLILKAVKRV